jgi:hypothetical protein
MRNFKKNIKNKKDNLGERRLYCKIIKKKSKMNSVSQVSRQHVRQKKNRKNRKTKEKECTTLASGLGVVPYLYIKQ